MSTMAVWEPEDTERDTQPPPADAPRWHECRRLLLLAAERLDAKCDPEAPVHTWPASVAIDGLVDAHLDALAIADPDDMMDTAEAATISAATAVQAARGHLERATRELRRLGLDADLVRYDIDPAWLVRVEAAIRCGLGHCHWPGEPVGVRRPMVSLAQKVAALAGRCRGLAAELEG